MLGRARAASSGPSTDLGAHCRCARTHLRWQFRQEAQLKRPEAAEAAGLLLGARGRGRWLRKTTLAWLMRYVCAQGRRRGVRRSAVRGNCAVERGIG